MRLVCVDQVPDLRMFWLRLAHCAISLVLGLVSAFVIARLLPHGHARAASHFAPLFLILGLGGGLALAYYALLDALRRWESPRRVSLPLARVITRSRG